MIPDSSQRDVIYVEAAARLHLGVLDLRRTGRRWFGGLGAGAPAPSVLVSVRPSDTFRVDGADASRAAQFAQRFLASTRATDAFHLHIHQALPRHAGLGSGTQLGLAVARAIAEFHGLPTEVAQLALAVGRGARSAVGTWTFDGGGLVVEGGRPLSGDRIGPLLARLAFPETWRVVVVVPRAGVPIAGVPESAAFASLSPPSDREVHEASYLVLMRLLPAVQEGELGEFGEALTALQALTGRWFAAAQGGTFASGLPARLIECLRDAGASGVGQSSWGPTVYGVTAGDTAAARLAAAARELLGPDGDIYAGPFRSTGARVWREPATPDRSRAVPL